MGFDDIMDALGEMADIADDLTNLPQAQEEGSGSQAKTEKISAPERTVKG